MRSPRSENFVGLLLLVSALEFRKLYNIDDGAMHPLGPPPPYNL